MSVKLIPYYRVSDKKQEAGHGLDGQDIAVAQYAAAYGGEIVKSYSEIESGTLASRPQLLRAIAHAKRSRARLVVARLDRLARDVEFTATLMNTKVDFVCCDNPTATPLTIHILAAVAEDEVKRIRARTSAALQAYVANKRLPKWLREQYPNGVPEEIASQYAGRLGSNHPACKKLSREDALKGSAKAAQVRSTQAREAYSDLVDWIKEMHESGMSLRAIASELNAAGHTTRGGKEWVSTTVLRVLRMTTTSTAISNLAQSRRSTSARVAAASPGSI
jgi:DNA invertase Pin-like site-specific DNA recombinase